MSTEFRFFFFFIKYDILFCRLNSQIYFAMSWMIEFGVANGDCKWIAISLSNARTFKVELYTPDLYVNVQNGDGPMYNRFEIQVIRL